MLEAVGQVPVVEAEDQDEEEQAKGELNLAIDPALRRNLRIRSESDSRGAKSLPQGLGGSAEQAKIAANCDEARTPFQITTSVRLDAGKNAGGFSSGPCPGEDVLDCLLNVGGFGMAEMTKRRGKIGWSDE